jgi:hypothetical protein
VRLRAELEQVFLHRRGGTVEARLVLERESGARERLTLILPVAEHAAGAELLGRLLARRDDVASVARCRLRLARGAAMVDDAALRDALRAAFAAERGRLGQPR